MRELTAPKAGTLALFNPAETKELVAEAESVISFAKKLQEWPLLEKAVDAKLDEQSKLLLWWNKNVTPAKQNFATQVETALAAVSVEKAQKLTQLSADQVDRWRKKLRDDDARAAYRKRILGVAYAEAMGEEVHNHRAQGTGENEWYTPAEYIAAAREVMGGIDLDPATSPLAQQTIGAARFFTREHDGLAQLWTGRVWLNPPYSQPDIASFCRKLVTEVGHGAVEQAILLTHNYTDTAWFHEAESLAAAICFTRGRVKFVDAGGNECAPTQGQAFFYYGKAVSTFCDVFGEFGFVR